jgi:phosphate-transporting ATPase
MLKIRGLTRFGLKSFDFDLSDGEAVAILGPSGSGKTLLLRAIADLDPNEGSVHLDGLSRERMPAPAWRGLVMYLPAEPGWWSESVRDHFEDREAARAFLPRLLLSDDALDWDVARLSTGERQRLALLRLLTRSPKVMLLDEPTSGLDPKAAKAVEEILRERLKAGTSLLFVTHDEKQARRLGRRCLRAHAGALEEAAL